MSLLEGNHVPSILFLSVLSGSLNSFSLFVGISLIVYDATLSIERDKEAC